MTYLVSRISYLVSRISYWAKQRPCVAWVSRYLIGCNWCWSHHVWE